VRRRQRWWWWWWWWSLAIIESKTSGCAPQLEFMPSDCMSSGLLAQIDISTRLEPILGPVSHFSRTFGWMLRQ